MWYQVVIGSIHVNLVPVVLATIKDSGVLPSSDQVNTCEFGTDLLSNHQIQVCYQVVIGSIHVNLVPIVWATIKDSGVPVTPRTRRGICSGSPEYSLLAHINQGRRRMPRP